MRFLKKIFCSISKRKNTYFGNGFSIERSYGCKWLIDWSNSVDKKMVYKLFEDKQLNYFQSSYLKYSPEYFLDIGSHGGMYSIILKKKFKELNVLSFEPDKQNRYQLYGNIFLNNLENEILIFDYGLSDINKEVSFGLRKEGNRGGKSIKEDGSEKITVKSLDKLSLFENKKCFVKIDVEGHEKNVIDGGKKFFKNNKCLSQVEILNKNYVDVFKVKMKNLGYDNIFKIEDYYFSNF